MERDYWRENIGAFNNTILNGLMERDPRIYAANTASNEEDPTIPEDTWVFRVKDREVHGWSCAIMISRDLIWDSELVDICNLIYRMIRF